MKRALLLPLMALAFCSVLQAYRWSSTLENNAHVSACVDGNVSFPWYIVTEGEEKILDIDWLFEAGGRDKVSFATYVDGSMVSNKERFTFLPNAGLLLQGARPHHAGRYYVTVSLHDPKCRLTSAQKMVTLEVADRPPATQDGAVHVTLRDAVRDDVTGDLTLQLHCGRFVDLGHPPVYVVWTTPSGEVRNSSREDNGTFVLSVSSPVQGGNYVCRLPPSAPAARCLPATSPLKTAARLYLDHNDVRLSLLEARQVELLSQHAQLRETILPQMTADMDNLTRQLSALNDKMDRFLHNPKELIKHRGNASSCVDWLAVDPRSGVRTVYVSGEAIVVFCDQDTDNGGWIVFQRRRNGAVDFDRGWRDYRDGFGDLEGSFWLGLDKLHRLTTLRSYELRVDMQRVDLRKGYATYSGFYLQGPTHNFALHFDNFTGGSVSDGLSYHRGQQFSTKDRDNDASSGNCAQNLHSAWWYKACSYVDLNRPYKTGGGGLKWYTFGTDIKFSEMKIRPV